ncbi:MAG: oxidoreductase-like domain-containing protein [Pseudomonadota bacterium]|jgi:Oxidoreductase-like protein, N-terminal
MRQDQNNSSRAPEPFRSAATHVGFCPLRRGIADAAYTGAVPDSIASSVSSAEHFHTPPDDPKPAPPERPGDNECCGSGCDPCVFDFYNDEMERYRQELRAWEARQAARQAARDNAATHS